MIGSMKKFYGMVNQQNVSDGYKWFLVEVLSQHSSGCYYCRDMTGRIFEAWFHELVDLNTDEILLEDIMFPS